MLDRVPLGGARGVMADGDYEAEAVGELGLEVVTPGAKSRAVAAAVVGQNEKLVGSWKMLAANLSWTYSVLLMKKHKYLPTILRNCA